VSMVLDKQTGKDKILSVTVRLPPSIYWRLVALVNYENSISDIVRTGIEKEVTEREQTKNERG
jgi:hypothetical protein